MQVQGVTADQLHVTQAALRLTNARMAETLGVTDRTYSYWKSGRIAVPNPAALALAMLVHYRPADSLVAGWTNN